MAKVNEGVYNGLESKEAIREAIDYCIENDILADFLIKHKAEVDDMLLSKEGVKIHEEAIRKEEFERGAMSRQEEIDSLTTDVERLKAILKANGIDPD